jgi:addiction module HigA family antidote
MSQNQLARALNVPPRRINEIVLGKRRITADTALRLAKFLGTSAEVWMNVQTRYDLDVTEDAIRDKIEKEIKPLENEEAA